MTQTTLFNHRRRPPRATQAGKLNAAQRSLAYLRGLGYTAEVCEKYIPRIQGGSRPGEFPGGHRKDLFGFADILAFDGSVIVAVQTTSRQQVGPHMRKFARSPEVLAAMRAWTRSGGLIEIHGWEPVLVPTKSRTAKAATRAKWELTRRVVDADFFNQSKEACDVGTSTTTA